MTAKCVWCGEDAYAWRTTRWGRDAVCRKCVHQYPAEGSFEPFEVAVKEKMEREQA